MRVICSHEQDNARNEDVRPPIVLFCPERLDRIGGGRSARGNPAREQRWEPIGRFSFSKAIVRSGALL